VETVERTLVPHDPLETWPQSSGNYYPPYGSAPTGGTPISSIIFCQASAKYEEQKPHHELLRQSFLLACLQDPTLMDAQHMAVSKLASMEWKRDAFHQIKALKGTPFCTNISQVEIMELQGPQLVSSQQAMEQALCQSLQSCFTKAHGSPFLHQPLLCDVGFWGCGQAAREIVEGSYQCPLEMDKYTWLFIEALQWPALHPDLISSILNMEAFCAHWHKARESTASSYSGLHFGHYKSVAANPGLAHIHA